MTEQSDKPSVDGLRELIDKYWELAHAEGAEGRTHDTANGDAQRVRSQIDAAIAALRTRLLRHPEGKE